MNITIVQGAFLPVPTLRGGAVEKMWFELGKQFSIKGHSVLHISRRFPGLPKSELIEGVKHLRVKGHDWPTNFLLLKLLDLFYSIRVLSVLPKADILVTNTFWLPILVFLFQQRFGKIVVDVQRIPKGQMRLYSYVACIRANSSSVFLAIKNEAPILSSKTVIIPNPLPYLPPPLSNSTRENIILFCGRLHPEKGIELLIRSYHVACQRGLTNWSLRLVGSADETDGGGGTAWLNRLINFQKQAGLSVEWLGPIYDEYQLQCQYQRAPIFVYPSLADKGESFGMAPLEAMAFGAVPIVSSVACFQDFIKPGSNGLIFNHLSPDASSYLASAMLQLVNNQRMRHSLSQAALEVRNTHNSSSIADSFLECFNSLLLHNKS